MAVITQRANSNALTFGQALDLYGTNEEISEKIDDTATQILNRTVRSSDLVRYEERPFAGLISLLYRLAPDIDLRDVPMEAESVLKQLKTKPTFLFNMR